MSHKSRFFQEILQQPQALRSTLKAFNETSSIDTVKALIEQAHTVILTGMGSSLAAAYYGACLLRQQSLRAIALDASELLHSQQSLLDRHTLLAIISQSGSSAELCKLLDSIEGRIPVLAITNSPQSQLACRSTAAMFLDSGEEQTASTKTYVCSLAMLYLLGTQLCATHITSELPSVIATIEHQFLHSIHQGSQVSPALQ